MANTTASACGVKMYLAAPSRKRTETKAEQLASGEITAGLAMPAAPSATGSRKGRFSSRRRPGS